MATLVKQLNLIDLSKGMPGLTSYYGAAMAEAGAVCFENQKHRIGVALTLYGNFNDQYQVFWPSVTQQMQNCWNDMEYTTEQAAYGIAFLVLQDQACFTIIERSRKGTGFDYWIGNPEDQNYPFQNKARLEVSGILSGDANVIKSRVRKKLKQVSRTDNTMLPAYIVVVEFSAPLTQVERK